MAYIGNGPGVASQRIVSTLTATDGQTSFTPTSGYTVGYVDVYLNGVKLISGTDFTASNGTNVVLTTGAATGDTLEVVAYLPRGLSDGYTKAEADARYYTQSQVDSEIAAIDLTAFNSPVQLKNYTTTQRNALTGLESGDTIYNSTTGSIEFYDGTNWIATNLIPTVNSVTGNIYVGLATTLTLDITNATETITVRFSEGGAIVADIDSVAVTSGSASVSVPAAVYGQTAGDTIAVTILNEDGTPASNSITKTVLGVPSGGTSSYLSSTNEMLHVFETTSNFVVPTGTSLSNVSFMVIAGGGGGSGDLSGGGGAGGYRSSWNNESSGGGNSAESKLSFTAGTSTVVTVGAGGAGSSASAVRGSSESYGNNGSASSIGSLITTVGGGRAGQYDSASVTSSKNGASGGSGGGAGSPSNTTQGTPGSGTSGQGYRGGYANSSVAYNPYSAGGGGGAGSVGGDGTSTSGGNGGSGVTSTITGTSVARAGGGGGSRYGSPTNSGNGIGQDGGGNGGYGDVSSGGLNATNGTQFTGGGGGGASWEGDPAPGGNGGAGLVVIRYQLS